MKKSTIFKAVLMGITLMMFIKMTFYESMSLIWILAPIWIPVMSIIVVGLIIAFIAIGKEKERLKKIK